jgi:hypothetical protein
MHQTNLCPLPKPLCYRNSLLEFLQGLTSMTTNPINQHMLLVVEYTRMTAILFQNNNSEAFENFKTYKEMVETET